jgi:hypothetical protein
MVNPPGLEAARQERPHPGLQGRTVEPRPTQRCGRFVPQLGRHGQGSRRVGEQRPSGRKAWPEIAVAWA